MPPQTPGKPLLRVSGLGRAPVNQVRPAPDDRPSAPAARREQAGEAHAQRAADPDDLATLDVGRHRARVGALLQQVRLLGAL